MEKDPSIQRQQDLLAEIEAEDRSVFLPPADQQRPEPGNPDQLNHEVIVGEEKPEVI